MTTPPNPASLTHPTRGPISGPRVCTFAARFGSLDRHEHRARWPTIEQILLATVLTVAVGGCALFNPEPSGTFTVVAPAQGLVDELVITVIDRTETVEAIAIERGHFPDGIFSEETEPAVLVVTWMGGMCDVRTTLTVETTIDTVQITEATERDPEVCRAAGITRSIAIRFDPPLPPEIVEFVPVLPGPAES